MTHGYSRRATYVRLSQGRHGLQDAQDGEPYWEVIFLVVRAPMRRAARSAMLTMGVDDVLAVDDALAFE